MNNGQQDSYAIIYYHIVKVIENAKAENDAFLVNYWTAELNAVNEILNARFE